MSKLNLENIDTGLPVSLNDGHRTINVAQWGVAPSGATVSVNLKNNGGVVNGAVFLELTCSGFSKSKHELKIMGHWGDLMGMMRAENDRILTVRDTNDLNYFHQTRSCYVYTDTDVHECSVTVSDGTNEVTVDFTCQMVADSVLLADTIYVDDAGLWAGTPSGARYVTSPSAALTILNNNQALNMKVLFRRGRTWNETFDGAVQTTTTARQVIIGTYGTGARPILNLSGSSVDGDGISFGSTQGQEVMHVFRFTGIRMVGTWDPTTETGKHGTGIQININQFVDTCVHDCDIVAFGDNLYARGFSLESQGGTLFDWFENPNYPFSCVVVSNSLFDLHGNYDMLISNERWSAVLGTKCTTHPQSYGGGRDAGGGTGNNFNGHGCRWSAASPLGFHCFRLSDFYCMYNRANDKRAQPCIRWNFAKRKDCKATVDRCQFEGSTGFNVGVNENNIPVRQDVDIWACHFILTAHSNSSPLNIEATNVWVKSCVFFWPDLLEVQGDGVLSKAIKLATGTPADQDAADGSVVFLNNTFVDHRTGSNQNTGGVHTQYLGQASVGFTVVVANDVYWYVEGASSPWWTDSGMDQLGTFVTAAPFNAHYESWQSFFSPTPNFSYTIPNGLAMLVEPGNVSAADLEVGQPFAPLDFFAANTNTRGAINRGTLAA